jgi:outer membrane protein assembly factor BamA
MTTRERSLMLLLAIITLGSVRANNTSLYAQGLEHRTQLYVVNEAVFNGAKSLSKQHLLRASKLRRGSIVTDARLNNASVLVSEAYINKGFSRVRVTLSKLNVSSFASDRALKINIVFEIEEGPQFLVRFLEIVGNRVTDDKTVRRSTGIKPWDPYNPRSLDTAIRRLSRIRTLDVVKKEDIEIKFDDSEHFVDIRFHLKEKGF